MRGRPEFRVAFRALNTSATYMGQARPRPRQSQSPSRELGMSSQPILRYGEREWSQLCGPYLDQQAGYPQERRGSIGQVEPPRDLSAARINLLSGPYVPPASM
jgi:hypothetical protein